MPRRRAADRPARARRRRCRPARRRPRRRTGPWWRTRPRRGSWSTGRGWCRRGTRRPPSTSRRRHPSSPPRGERELRADEAIHRRPRLADLRSPSIARAW